MVVNIYMCVGGGGGGAITMRSGLIGVLKKEKGERRELFWFWSQEKEVPWQSPLSCTKLGP